MDRELEIGKAAILDEILELSGVARPVETGEFTAAEFAERGGISLTTARRRLQQLVNAGIVKERPATDSRGYRCKAYRKA